MTATDHWNDSRLGDYLWSSGNVIEAIPEVMTPATQSAFELLAVEATGPRTVDGHPLWGTIAGRFYFNLSTIFSVAEKMRTAAVFRELADQSVGLLPADVEVPRVDVSLAGVVRDAGPHEMRVQTSATLRGRRFRKRATAVPARCAEARRLLDGCSTTDELAACWNESIEPLTAGGRVLMRHAQPCAIRMALAHRALRRLVGEEAANALTGSGAELDSLAVLLGLDALDSGAIDGAAFAARFGHRGPHEVELSRPRPGEDPAWVEAQRRWFHTEAPTVSARLEAQADRRDDARRRASTTARLLADTWIRAATRRELLRSEYIRTHGVLRDFLRRVAAVTGIDDDVWFLTLDEVPVILGDDLSPLAHTDARRARHEHHAALPRYPTLIRGAFDPDAWASASEPRRPPAGGEDGALRGFAGAEGRVEATARVILDLDHASDLRPGEVLVTPLTNVGWTPLLVCAAAVVTDIGAPLSHAAIVARELGIPAVVGCGDATTRIRNGDRVVVDGASGTVAVAGRP